MKKERNWAQYNESLFNRARITFWFRDDVLKLWNHDNRDYRRGRPFIYSDTTIETLLLIRGVFHLTYRGTEGIGRDAFLLLGVQDSRIPDYSSICKRSQILNVSLKVRNKRGPLNVIVDSTSLKVYGEGKWKVKKHGVSKRRTWRKLHVMIDAKTQQVVAAETTSNSVDDASVVPNLLSHCDSKIKTLRGDGAYDKRKVYKATSEQGIQPIIPHRKTLDSTTSALGERTVLSQRRHRNSAIVRFRRMEGKGSIPSAFTG